MQGFQRELLLLRERCLQGRSYVFKPTSPADHCQVDHYPGDCVLSWHTVSCQFFRDQVLIRGGTGNASESVSEPLSGDQIHSALHRNKIGAVSGLVMCFSLPR